jgi:hypothetical protein
MTLASRAIVAEQHDALLVRVGVRYPPYFGYHSSERAVRVSYRRRSVYEAGDTRSKMPELLP